MIKEDKIKKEVIVYEKHRYCDDCGVEMTTSMYKYSRSICTYCGKDICRKCVGYEDDSCGDYSDIYCKKCWELGNEYRLKIKELDNEIDKLYDEWKTKCKENKK